MFLDERGAGLRVTWHPERDLVVLSVWQGDRCVGTFRMSVQDVPRLSGLLAAALGDWVDQTGPDPGSGGPGAWGQLALAWALPAGPGTRDPPTPARAPQARDPLAPVRAPQARAGTRGRPAAGRGVVGLDSRCSGGSGSAGRC